MGCFSRNWIDVSLIDVTELVDEKKEKREGRAALFIRAGLGSVASYGMT